MASGRVSQITLTGTTVSAPRMGRVSRITLTGTNLIVKGRVSRITLTGEAASGMGRVSRITLTGTTIGPAKGRVSRITLTGSTVGTLSSNPGPNRTVDGYPDPIAVSGAASGGSPSSYTWTCVAVSTAYPNPITTADVVISGSGSDRLVSVPASAVPVDVTLRLVTSAGGPTATQDVVLTVMPWVREWSRVNGVSQPVLEYYRLP